MEISSSQINGIKSMLSSRKEGDEVEAAYHVFPSSKDRDGSQGLHILRDGMTRLFQYMKKYAYTVIGTSQTIDVSLNNGIRFTMEAKGATGPAIPDPDKFKIVEVLHKQRIREPVDVPEHRLRVQMKNERPIKGAELAEAYASVKSPRDSRTYRMKWRWSFVPDGLEGALQIDLTSVRQIQKNAGERPPTIEELARAPEHYEAEIEVVGSPTSTTASSVDALSNALLEQFCVILQLLDDTNAILSTSQRAAVLKEYSDVLKTTHFVGPKPVSLEMEHLACASSGGGRHPCISKEYTVTEKADGQRRLLWISGITNRVYSIDNHMFVRDTGRQAKGALKGPSLLDGEYLPEIAEDASTHKKGIPERFLVFDVMIAGGKDVRGLPFILRGNANGTLGASHPSADKKKNGGGSSSSKEPEDRLGFAKRVLTDLVNRPEGEDGYGQYVIALKEFYESWSPQELAESCRHIFIKEDSGRIDYHVDGLIFTPALLPMPKDASARTWNAVMKWKPPNQNSIDFQVCFHPSNSSSNLVVDGNKVWRVVDLLVGQDQWNATPITAMEYLSNSVQQRLQKKQQYSAVPFSPPLPLHSTGSPSENKNKNKSETASSVHLAYLPMDAQGRVKCDNGDEIIDGTVVEFSYNLDNHKANADFRHHPTRWEPMRVRWDKTNSSRLTGRVKANDIENAMGVWRTIVNPITKDMLTTSGGTSKALDALERMSLDSQNEEESLKGSYYVSQLRADEGGSGGLRRFHNWVKQDVLLMPFAKGMGRSIFDLGCGRGGDLQKWIAMGAERVVGIDKSTSNLYDPVWSNSAAYVRLLEAKGFILGKPHQEKMNKAPNLKCVFLPMDASKAFGTQAYIDSLDEASGDRAVARCLWGFGDIEAVRPPALKPYFRMAANPFDLATCMFALHYLFESPETLDVFVRNVDGVLKPGGHFLGCCLDGKLVDALLAADAPKVGASVGPGSWRITRRYEGGTVPKGKKRKNGDQDPIPHTKFGRKIDVFIESIGQELPEFLFDYDDLVTAFAKVGIRPLNEVEANRLGLQGSVSTGTFDELFDSMKAKYEGKASVPPAIATALTMSKDEKQYSFLNRWFVFVKK